MIEKDLEKKLVREIAKKGGKALKLNSSIRGLPDRIILMPEGNITFVEMKAPGGKPRPLQQKRIKMLQQLGFKVEVLSTVETVEAFLKEVIQ